jgi:uncharacterized iron-regulated membrane protein
VNAPGERPLPQGLMALGYAGLLPFIACVLAIAPLEGEARAFAVRALVAYGAVILSFLGAVHWGLLLRRPAAGAPVRLAIGVLPSLTGWAALLLPERYALALLVVALGGFWLYEHRVVGTALLPPDYLKLRRSLTLAVCALLTLGLLSVG